MPIEGKDLLEGLRNNRQKMGFNRLQYMERQANEQELVAFFSNLLVQALEGRELNSYAGLEQLLAEWEDKIIGRFAAGMTLPSAENIPWTPVTKPLNKMKFALLTTGGIFVDGQESYVRGGKDVSYRAIPKGTPQAKIRAFHPAYDTSGPLQDVDCMLPLHRFAELEQQGVIGALADENYSFMGLITDHTLLAPTAAEVAEKVKAQGVDAALLTAA